MLHEISNPKMTSVAKAVEVLREAGVTEDHPITPDHALRFRGIGPKTLPLLEDLGLVRLDDFADLPTKIGNLVKLAGYKSRDEVNAAIEANCFILDRETVWFRHREDESYRNLRNCGAQTFHQIRAWAGYHA